MRRVTTLRRRRPPTTKTAFDKSSRITELLSLLVCRVSLVEEIGQVGGQPGPRPGARRGPHESQEGFRTAAAAIHKIPHPRPLERALTSRYPLVGPVDVRDHNSLRQRRVTQIEGHMCDLCACPCTNEGRDPTGAPSSSPYSAFLYGSCHFRLYWASAPARQSRSAGYSRLEIRRAIRHKQ